MAVRTVRDRGKSSVVSLVVVSVIVLVLGGAAALLFGPTSSYPSRDVAPKAISMSNAKQVAIAVAMYSVDWDDRYPVGMLRAREFQYILDPYVKNPSVFRSRNPAGGIFEPNPNLAGVPTEGVENFEAAALFFETYDWSDGKRVVAFADTHAEFVASFDVATDLEVELTEEAKKIVDEMALQKERQESAPPATGPLGMPRG